MKLLPTHDSTPTRSAHFLSATAPVFASLSAINRKRISLSASLFLFLWLVASAFAAPYLQPGQVDGVALLPPPPAIDSAEQVADLASARVVFKARTAAEETRSMKSATLSLFNFAPAIAPEFQPGKLPKMEALFERLKTNVREVIDIPKDHWQRKRPYQLDGELSLGNPEKSFSYPSGHATYGVVQSLILAELFPDKREAILQIGRHIGWDRVLIGKHFPTDVYAGRVLGQAIVRELKTSADFRRDLAEAKAEADGVLK